MDADPTVVDRPVAFSVGAYGPLRGTPRLLRLLESRGVRATFFVPGWIAERWPDVIRSIVADGHELAHHGYLHELYFTLSLEEIRDRIERSQRVFRKVADQEAVGFRGPTGDVREGTPELLRSMGFSYSSTMRGDDRPYRWIINGEPSDLIEIPADYAVDDFPQFGYHDDPADPVSLDRIAAVSGALDNWRREFDGCYRDGACFVLILHPQVIGTPGRAKAFGTLLDYIRGHEGVWMAPLADIADWWRERH
jgi:peptidoglycan/xylan/chitin deacetylase (PgdA/CDA1 family)